MPATWNGRFADYLKRTLALRESTSLEVLPDLMPVFPVVNAAGLEQCGARGDILVGGGMDTTAAAAQFPTGWFGLEAASANMLTVITQLVVSTFVDQLVQVGIRSATIPAVGIQTLGTDDQRLPNGRARTRVQQSSEAALLGSSGMPSRRLRVNATTVIIPVQAVLTAGNVLVVQGETAQSRLVAWVQGYERQAMKDEVARSG